MTSINKFAARIAITLVSAFAVGACAVRAAEPGNLAIVVYNSAVPESKELADYYAKIRNVPAEQVFGFELPKTEDMSRAEFRDQLQKPLLAKLSETKLFTLVPEIKPATNEKAGEVLERIVAARIRYAVLCYGVPTRIRSDATIIEPGMENVRAELRRNEAAVDSELAFLPIAGLNPSLSGPKPNPLYAATNSAPLHPANGVLMVARLDGPTAAIAKGLVTKALEAEERGLWGRAYFDARGLTNGSYRIGDTWIRTAAEVTRRLGFETVLDENGGTFPAAFPMSHIALYAGWYDGNVSGPFAQPEVEFMPGAIAYHLHSYSARTLRSTNQNWVGPLLAKGATATMGCVDEPYLEGTPDLAVFFSRLLIGFTFGEAAYASQRVLSWQTTVVGDPLYRPVSALPERQHEKLVEQGSPLIEWSHLRIVNLNHVTDLPFDELVGYIERLRETGESAVLLEKLGDLHASRASFTPAIAAYEKALKKKPSPQQRIRLLWSLGKSLGLDDQNDKAYELFQSFLKDYPRYPDPVGLYRKLESLATKLRKKDDADKYKAEIEKLTAPPPPAPPKQLTPPGAGNTNGP